MTLVAPDAVDELARLAAEGSIAWERRAYEPADLEGTFMVIAATNDTDVNIGIYDDAERRAMLVNVVDVPPLCNFILPAIVRTGPMAIAISTAGASPALAKRMKREISEHFGEAYAELAVILNDARGWAKGTLPTYHDRKDFFEGIVNGDPDPVELIREGRARRGADAIIEAAKRHATAPASQAPPASPRLALGPAVTGTAHGGDRPGHRQIAEAIARVWSCSAPDHRHQPPAGNHERDHRPGAKADGLPGQLAVRVRSSPDAEQHVEPSLRWRPKWYPGRRLPPGS